MNKTIPLAIIGGIIAIAIIVSLLTFNNKNDIIPDHYIQVIRGDNFSISVPFTNNSTTTEGRVHVNVTLTTPAEISLNSYVFSIFPSKDQGNKTITIKRDHSFAYTVEYESLSGKKKLNVDNLEGVSFDAKVGTAVTYSSSNDLTLLKGETAEFKYEFKTNAAQIGTYDIKAFVNDNPILYRVKVRA